MMLQSDGLSKRYSDTTQVTRCAVKTEGLSSLSFMPFVRSCLTDPDCCNPANGATVSFWFYKDELNKVRGELRPQRVPLHVFRSPYLLVTMQEGYLTVTYHHASTTSTVRAEMVESSWRFVTVTYDPDALDPDTVVKIYRNKAEVTETVSESAEGAWSTLAEFESANTSFQVFSTEDSVGVVTSSDIRPIAITNLRIFYAALSDADVERMFLREQNADLPAKVIRMSTTRKLFLDHVTQEDVAHIRLQCLIRVPRDAPLIVRFMYTNDVQNEQFQEMTSDIFEMRTYLKVNSQYHSKAVVQILGRHDGSALPLYYTCDLVSVSHVSGYGYAIIGIHDTTQIVESTHYWTKFFDSGPPDNDGEENESKETHEALAATDGYELLCEDPVYAECRAKTTPSSNTSVQWYDATPTFVPKYDYMCDKKGILCSPQDDDGNNQKCPDLLVRYACLKPPSAAQPTESGGETNGPLNPTSNSQTMQQPNSDQHPKNDQQPNYQQPSNDTTLTSGSVTAPSTGGQQSETNGNTENSFKKAIKDNLNWIYPVLIVAFGAGIPTMIACYFLCRKKTPAEIEAQMLLIEKLREEANRPTSVKGRHR